MPNHSNKEKQPCTFVTSKFAVAPKDENSKVIFTVQIKEGSLIFVSGHRLL